MISFLEKHYKKFIILILAFVAFVSVMNAWWDGLIFDEDAHIPAGYSYIAFHDMRLNPEHPPMIKDFTGIMVSLFHPRMDISKDYWTTEINGEWDAGHDLLWQQGNPADPMIFWARIPVIILTLIFALFIFKWVRELAGITAGLFAMFLFAFDPNILGHDHFVTTDLAIAGFMMISFYYFLRFIKDPTWKNVLIGGIFLGLVQLAKFSSITIFPIYGLVLIIYPLVKASRPDQIKPSKWKNLGEYLWKGIIAGIVSIIIVWGVYAVNIYKMPQDKLSQTIEYYFPHDDPSAKARLINKISNALDKETVTRPLSEYFLGVAMVFKRVEGGNGAYFIGRVSGQGFLAYFPTVFTLKEPLPTLMFYLLALILGLGGTIKIWRTQFETEKWLFIARYIRENIVSLSLFAFVVLYAYVAITSNLNIGFRHLFPILPFAFILTATSIFGYLKKLERPSSQTWGIIIVLLCIFLFAETVSAYPYYMSYFNELAGGPKLGYRYVTDSNADWGQDIKRLKVWIEQYNECKINIPLANCQGHSYPQVPIDKIRVNYFGGADVHYYLGDTYIDWWDSKRPIEPGWYAISTNYIMGSIYDTTKKDNESYRWLQNIKPVYQVGTAIFIYYVTPQDIQNLPPSDL